MNDEAKLGLVAGVLAVIGVAVFGMPKEPVSVKADSAVTAKPPSIPAPASVKAAAE